MNAACGKGANPLTVSGLRLYAIVLDPIWSFTKGSSSSFLLVRCRMSLVMYIALGPKPLIAFPVSPSTFQEYVCLETSRILGKLAFW